MSIQRISQLVEIKFWGAVTPILESEGPVMKITKLFYRFIHTKAGYISILILLWSAIGFVAGMIIGRVIGYYQIF
jgi:hypothetical protein